MNQTDSFFAAIKLSLFRYHQTHLTMWRSICNSVTCGMLWEPRFHSLKLLPRCSVTHDNLRTGNYSWVGSEHLLCCANVSLCRKLKRNQFSSMIIPNFLASQCIIVFQNDTSVWQKQNNQLKNKELNSSRIFITKVNAGLLTLSGAAFHTTILWSCNAHRTVTVDEHLVKTTISCLQVNNEAFKIETFETSRIWIYLAWSLTFSVIGCTTSSSNVVFFLLLPGWDIALFTNVNILKANRL